MIETMLAKINEQIVAIKAGHVVDQRLCLAKFNLNQLHTVYEFVQSFTLDCHPDYDKLTQP